MPTLSLFHGVAIRMFFNDHEPPHFHAFFAGDEARVAVDTGEIVSGRLPRAQRRLVKDWTLRYNAELLKAWADVRAERTPERIPGLDPANEG